MKVTFLGTAAARPTVGRNVSSLVLHREGETLMFDCGEGTQRQMMRYGTGFAIDDIFFSHLHADHFIGVIGLVRTMGLQGRDTPIRLWTPAGTEEVLAAAINVGADRVGFETTIIGVRPGERIERGEYAIQPFETAHVGASVGYAVTEHERLGRFDPERARELGIPEGPLWGKLHHGQPVEIGGRTIDAAEVVGPPRPGRTFVYTGDTRPSQRVREIASGADLLIHEATFTHQEAKRAAQTRHSTAREAARVAKDADVRRLALTHFSPRYADDPRVLEREARAIFPETVAAYDGMEIEIPFRDA